MPMPTTFSTWTTETVQGKHVFRVVGYTQARDIDGGRLIKSGVFSVGGHTWAIFFRPTCVNTQIHPDCVLIALMLVKKGSPEVRASYEVSLVDQITGMPVLVHKGAPIRFDQDIMQASHLAEKRSVFEGPRYLRDDSLTMEVIVTVFSEETIPETRSFSKIEVPPSDMKEQFGRLLETGQGVDVSFIVAGESFRAHKIVLATRSPVFQAQFYGSLRKEGTEPVTIVDLQPTVFRALLHFIYTDSLPAMDDLEGDDRFQMISQLLVTADRYAIERLKLMCQSILCENLCVQTVPMILALADQHHCHRLMDACIEFITCSKAWDDVVATKGYKSLKRSCPSVVIETLEKIRKTHRG